MSKRRANQYASLIMAVALAATLAGCAAADDVAMQVARRASQTDDYARYVARMLRGVTATEDDALRLGERILASNATELTAEARIGNWIGDAITRLSPEEQAQVRGIALSATCDALDSVAQGETPDLGSMVVSGIGSLSELVDSALLAGQLNEMLGDMQSNSSYSISARVEILWACIQAD